MNAPTTDRFSDRDFAELGAPHLVYIRSVKSQNGDKSFCLHAANGIKLADAPSFPEALMVARSHELMPVSVH
ncbi:hypothetical protein JCM17846_00060 [Iodidimonas nitroreducens]|uniref:DUF1150 domain-containing protein n=1 Tax=Iodidimonas nitroreducens TaxID=1236968 RepID=A0A5A7N3L0_9PROT|nr:DUF1150 family protein [Iodidimonas nitroreducens]GAK34924.1 putative small protein [alpha proteobacterium Q-1]GER02324.1 hypothetical protein JCM17846_00060 [Iodidimonas nitroreducens]